MTIFNHISSFNYRYEDNYDLFDYKLEYDDAFNIRREYNNTFYKSNIDNIKIAGTASSNINIYHGIVDSIDGKYLIVILPENKINCIYNIEEKFYKNDTVLVFDHMDHDYGMYGKFNLMATKKNGQFLLNSIKLICLKNNIEIGFIAIDPFNGQVNLDDLDTSRF